MSSSVRGPTYVIKTGKTPVLTTAETRNLFESIPRTTVAGLRDIALISVMAYSFARIGAVLGMNVADYYQQGRRSSLRLNEKGGKFHEVPSHHCVEEALDAYLLATGIGCDPKGPLFRTLNSEGALTARRLNRRDALAMVKRRSRAAGLGRGVCNHSFRATGITNFLEHGGAVETAMRIADHESPRTTKLYDRRMDQLTVDEIERIRFE